MNDRKAKLGVAKNILFDGREKVRLNVFSRNEFRERDLRHSRQVATYDADELLKGIETNFERPNICKRIYTAWVSGFYGRSVGVALLFLIPHYLVNYFIIQKLCTSAPENNNDSQSLDPDSNLDSNPESGFIGDIVDTGCFMYKERFKELAETETTFTRILTFLLGFYVSFIFRRWWNQVSRVPTIDPCCLLLQGLLWCDPEKGEDNVFVKEGVSVTRFKQTVARYCLLSWTMCMSMLSPPLYEKFKTPQDFHDHKLLTHEEYIKLKTKSETGDGWKVKWAVPLIWANTLLCDASTKPKDAEFFKVKDAKEILRPMAELQRKLEFVSRYADNRIPPMVGQAIRLCTLFWFFMGIFSSQGLLQAQEDKITLPVALLFNFPLTHCIKYILVFSWLLVATYLENPFGYDE